VWQAAFWIGVGAWMACTALAAGAALTALSRIRDAIADLDCQADDKRNRLRADDATIRS